MLVVYAQLLNNFHNISFIPTNTQYYPDEDSHTCSSPKHVCDVKSNEKVRQMIKKKKILKEKKGRKKNMCTLIFYEPACQRVRLELHHINNNMWRKKNEKTKKKMEMSYRQKGMPFHGVVATRAVARRPSLVSSQKASPWLRLEPELPPHATFPLPMPRGKF